MTVGFGHTYTGGAGIEGTVIGDDHQLSELAPGSRGGWVRAVCSCGWSTPQFRNSGLAESMLDAHVEQEQSRQMWITASMILLQTRAQRASSIRDRLLLAEVMESVRDASRPYSTEYPFTSNLLKIVAVDGDRAHRIAIAEALRQHGEFLVVGEGSSIGEALALSILERPRLVLIGDQTDRFEGANDVDLIRELSPDSRVCLYSSIPTVARHADLVLDKSLPVQAMIDHLVRLAG